MNGWPTRWRQQILEDLGIPVSQHALDVLKAWKDSTPLQPYSNNPLGLDARKANLPSIANTNYAQFRSMSHFRSELVKLGNTTPGRKVKAALTEGATFSEAWHAIRSLNTPGKHTETDYPHHVLALSSKAYEENSPQPSDGKRKTTGVVGANPAPHVGARMQAQALHHAAHNFTDHTKAIEYIIKRLS
jgi:hypothetical protein